MSIIKFQPVTNMRNLIVLFLVNIVCLIVNGQTDYCKLSCDGEINIACQRKDVNCGIGPKCGENYELISLTDEDKQSILNVHNEIRNRVATGRVRLQPSASNMKALNYNSELGYLAQCMTNTCNMSDQCSRTESYSYVGQRRERYSFHGGGDVGYKKVLHNTIREDWFGDVQFFNASWVSSFEEIARLAGAYTQLVWADTKEVGCGITRMENGKWVEYFITCNYGPGGNIIGAPVYETGSPASACTPELPVNSNYPGLCGQDYIN